MQALIRECRARGVVYHALKFCDSSLYDYALLRRSFVETGIPVLYLETEYREAGLEQARTRIQAFLELLDHPQAGEIMDLEGLIRNMLRDRQRWNKVLSSPLSYSLMSGVLRLTRGSWPMDAMYRMGQFTVHEIRRAYTGKAPVVWSSAFFPDGVGLEPRPVSLLAGSGRRLYSESGLRRGDLEHGGTSGLQPGYLLLSPLRRRRRLGWQPAPAGSPAGQYPPVRRGAAVVPEPGRPLRGAAADAGHAIQLRPGGGALCGRAVGTVVAHPGRPDRTAPRPGRVGGGIAPERVIPGPDAAGERAALPGAVTCIRKRHARLHLSLFCRPGQPRGGRDQHQTGQRD